MHPQLIRSWPNIMVEYITPIGFIYRAHKYVVTCPLSYHLSIVIIKHINNAHKLCCHSRVQMHSPLQTFTQGHQIGKNHSHSPRIVTHTLTTFSKDQVTLNVVNASDSSLSPFMISLILRCGKLRRDCLNLNQVWQHSFKPLISEYCAPSFKLFS